MQEQAHATRGESEHSCEVENILLCLWEKCLKSTHLHKYFCHWILLWAFSTLYIISAEVQLRGRKCLLHSWWKRRGTDETPIGKERGQQINYHTIIIIFFFFTLLPAVFHLYFFSSSHLQHATLTANMSHICTQGTNSRESPDASLENNRKFIVVKMQSSSSIPMPFPLQKKCYSAWNNLYSGSRFYFSHQSHSLVREGD